ncbi:MAG: aldo/keto reductase [Phycisphaerae bacterium]
MKRRDFLKVSAGTFAVIAAGPRIPAAEEAPKSNRAALPRRPYGKTGEHLSVIGFSGLTLARIDQDRTDRLVAWAVERGCNFFEVAAAYGNAEVKLGPALEPYRKDVFLSTKTKRRDAEGAKAELERSLARLRTDHLDLYHLHCLIDVEEDVKRVFAKGGAWEVIGPALEDGRIRHVAFSAHTEATALAAMDHYDFDSFLLPINPAAWFKAGFGPKVLEKAKRKGIQPLAIKPLARQAWTRPRKERKDETYGWMWYQPVSDAEERDLSIRWALSHPITSLMPPHDETLWRKAVTAGMDYRPMDDAGLAKVKHLASALNPLFPRN